MRLPGDPPLTVTSQYYIVISTLPASQARPAGADETSPASYTAGPLPAVARQLQMRAGARVS